MENLRENAPEAVGGQSPRRPRPAGLTAQLCGACGFCCNGVLFADVRLQKDDRPAPLRALGLELQKIQGRWQLNQPCSCWNGAGCRVYPQRPARCRTFECRLLERAHRGDITLAAAWAVVRRAREQAGRVEELLARFGQRETHLPLSRRCTEILGAPYDLAGDPTVLDLRGELSLAVHDLMQTLASEFL